MRSRAMIRSYESPRAAMRAEFARKSHLRQIRIPHYLPGAVDAESLAIGPAERSQVHHSGSLVPEKCVVGPARGSRVSDHLILAVDSDGNRVGATQSREYFQAPGGPNRRVGIRIGVHPARDIAEPIDRRRAPVDINVMGQ